MIDWQNLLHIADIRDVCVLPNGPRPAGIYYAANGVTDWPQLRADIIQVLVHGLRNNRAPAGLRVGGLSAGVVSRTYTYHERDKVAIDLRARAACGTPMLRLSAIPSIG